MTDRPRTAASIQHFGPRTINDMWMPGAGKGIELVATVDDDVRAARCLVPMSVYPPGREENSLNITALIDTGASQSAITPLMASVAQLPVVNGSHVSAPGTSYMPVLIYLATLELWKPGYDPGQAAHVFPDIRLTTLLSPVNGIHLLLGMDLLRQASFSLEPDGRWILKL